MLMVYKEFVFVFYFKEMNTLNYEKLFSSPVKNLSSSNIHAKVKLATDITTDCQRHRLYMISPLGFSGSLPYLKAFRYTILYSQDVQTVDVPLLKRVSDVVRYVCGKDSVTVSPDGHTFTIEKSVPVVEIYGLPSVCFDVPGHPQSNDFLSLQVDVSYNGNIVGKGTYIPGESSVTLKHTTMFQLQRGVSSVEIHLMHGDHSEITSNSYLNTSDFVFNCRMCVCDNHLQ